MELPDVPFNKSEYIETASGNRSYYKNVRNTHEGGEELEFVGILQCHLFKNLT